MWALCQVHPQSTLTGSKIAWTVLLSAQLTSQPSDGSSHTCRQPAHPRPTPPLVPLHRRVTAPGALSADYTPDLVPLGRCGTAPGAFSAEYTSHVEFITYSCDHSGCIALATLSAL